jgi:leucyl/phenylalanyl-tRNA--protein transferase
MQQAYQKLHRLGYAHSVEAWDEDEQLVGGIYGVTIGGYFSGESMFHSAPNASKLALLTLVDHLIDCGLNWLDCQVLTPHMAVLGAREIPRDEFLNRLELEQLRGLNLFGNADTSPGSPSPLRGEE